MLTVRQFRYAADNLAYLIHGDREAIAVDGGAVTAICDYIRDAGLTLTAVTHTHGHPDHTSGTRDLVRRTGAKTLDHRELARAGRVEIGGEPVVVLATPGHTTDSVCYYTGDALVSGDTLFNGTVGNPFSGDLDAFYDSIRRLLALPEATIVYGGHDYVHESMAFARELMPENPAIDRYLAAYDPAHVRSTLADERAVDPYLRFDDPEIVALLEGRGLPVGTSRERWHAVMTLG